MIPGAVLLLVPPLIVMLTGLLFIPGMFTLVRERVIAERQLLDRALRYDA